MQFFIANGLMSGSSGSAGDNYVFFFITALVLAMFGTFFGAFGVEWARASIRKQPTRRRFFLVTRFLLTTLFSAGFFGMMIGGATAGMPLALVATTPSQAILIMGGLFAAGVVSTAVAFLVGALLPVQSDAPVSNSGD